MGVVYEAEDLHLGRKVALSLAAAGGSSHERAGGETLQPVGRTPQPLAAQERGTSRSWAPMGGGAGDRRSRGDL